MSDATEAPETIELPHDDTLAFAALMDALAPTTDASTPVAGEQAAGVASANAGQPAAPADATGGKGAEAPVQPGGDAGGDSVPAGGQAGGTAPGTDLPATWTANVATVVPQIASLAGKIEKNLQDGFLQEALAAVREDHSKYFEALEKHPRTLVGQQVPSLMGEGMETLRDSADAKEWQEAVRQTLIDEVRSRAQQESEANAPMAERLTQSIDIFVKNKDLVPHTKEFNVALANRFARLAKPYEQRLDGKLVGYTVPVQGLIDQVREQLAEEKSAAAVPPTPAAPTAPPAQAPAPAAPAEQPQAGIPSRAGNSGEQADDYSTLFGTLGLPNLKF